MKVSIRKDIYFLLILTLLAGVLYGFKLGAFGLLDPDEPFYSLTAKEMLARHDPWVPMMFGQPQFEKPALTYWVLYLFFKFFGVSEWAARLGPCLAGILTVLVTYLWARVLFKKSTAAFVSAAVLMTALEFVIISRIVLTDMFLCLFVTAAFFCFSLGYEHPKYRKAAWVFIFAFCGLGFLTKGPLGLLLPFFGIVSYLLWNEEPNLLSKEMPWAAGLLVFFVVVLPWYGFMAMRFGAGFLKQFFIHENVRRFFVAEHASSDKWFFYPAAIFVGFFPWTPFVPGGLVYGFKQALRGRSRNQKMFLFLVLSVVPAFIFFTLAKSKLLSYIFPVFPAVALILGAWMYRIYKRSRWKKKYALSFALIVTATFFLSGVAFGWLLPKLDNRFSSKEDVAFYQRLSSNSEKRFLLASKLYVRGVSFYSGQSWVGVLIEDPRDAFYTQHPIPLLFSREDLLRIDKGQFPVYCFLRQKEFNWLKNIAGSPLNVSVLATHTRRMLVKLERMDKIR